MRILTYLSSLTDDAPPAYRCAARFLLPDGTPHPCVFHGPDKPSVKARAETWWDAEIEAARKKHGITEVTIAARREAKARAAAKAAEVQPAEIV